MNSPPAYVIIGHGKERQVDGHDDLKHRLDNEQLSFLVKSGEIADHDVIEIVRELSSDLNAYKDFSKKNGYYLKGIVDVEDAKHTLLQCVLDITDGPLTSLQIEALKEQTAGKKTRRRRSKKRK